LDLGGDLAGVSGKNICFLGGREKFYENDLTPKLDRSRNFEVIFLKDLRKRCIFVEFLIRLLRERLQAKHFRTFFKKWYPHTGSSFLKIYEHDFVFVEFLIRVFVNPSVCNIAVG
jgi:hypothetical protein